MRKITTRRTLKLVSLVFLYAAKTFLRHGLVKPCTLTTSLSLKIFPEIWFGEKVYFSNYVNTTNSPMWLVDKLNSVDVSHGLYFDPVNIKSRETPSIFYARLPKSAAGTISMELRAVLGLSGMSTSFGLLPDYVDYLIPKWVSYFSKGGMITGDHTSATEYNLNILKSSNITKVVVNVRDLRQVMVSLLYHFERYTLQEDSIWRPNKHHWLPEDYTSYTVEDKLTWIITNYLHLNVSWIDAWVRAEQDEKDLSIMFTTYEGYVKDKLSFYNNILDWYGITGIDLEKQLSMIHKKMHFRSGKMDEWREVMSDKQIHLMHEIIPLGMREKFGWLD